MDNKLLLRAHETGHINEIWRQLNEILSKKKKSKNKDECGEENGKWRKQRGIVMMKIALPFSGKSESKSNDFLCFQV